MTYLFQQKFFNPKISAKRLNFYCHSWCHLKRLNNTFHHILRFVQFFFSLIYFHTNFYLHIYSLSTWPIQQHFILIHNSLFFRACYIEQFPMNSLDDANYIDIGDRIFTTIDIQWMLITTFCGCTLDILHISMKLIFFLFFNYCGCMSVT